MNKTQLKEKIFNFYEVFKNFYNNSYDVFQPKNLKCYDANYYLYDGAEKDYPLLDENDRARVWEDFCDCEFDNFRFEFELNEFKKNQVEIIKSYCEGAVELKNMNEEE